MPIPFGRILKRAATTASLLTLFFALAAPQGYGQEGSGQEKRTLPEGLTPSAMKKINLDSVTKTISYLASDELEGRGTFSRGYKKAAEYAVKRFKAAGAKPGAGDSFFHITKRNAIKMPTKDVVVKGTGPANPKFLGLLAAGKEKFEFSGNIPVVTSREKFDDPEDKLNGPVAVVWNKRSRGQMATRSLAIFAGRAKKAGATALILVVKKKSSLIGISEKASGIGMLIQGPIVEMPVALVSCESPTEKDLSNTSWKMEVPPAIRFDAEMRNVVAVFPGSDKEMKDQAVLFSAHLDHLGKVGDVIYNGADDDATGVTAVLTLADAFGALKTRPKRTVAFILYWGEERGLLGSREYVKNPSIPLKNIVCNVNIEMIGRPEPGATGKVWVTGWEKSNLGQLMNQDASKFGVEIFEHPKFSSMLYRSSDNWPFAQAGVIAHSFSAGSLHNDYHKPTDDWEKLDLQHMTEVIRGLFVGSFGLTEGRLTPKAN